MNEWVTAAGWTLAGGAALTWGADLFVAAASDLGARLGVSPRVIGLTVVAMGTSAPELAVSLLAASQGDGGVALGNVLGSNTFNVLTILGLAAWIRPLEVSEGTLRVDLPAALAATALCALLGADGALSAGDGALLLVGLLVYLVGLVRAGAEAVAEQAPSSSDGRVALALRLVAGPALMFWGTRAFLAGATGLAAGAGVSQRVIGLTLVAAGTSAPELITSVVAAWRGHSDLAVANVVGSNIVNILGILGAASLATAGLPFTGALYRVDLPVAAAATLLCWPLAWTGRVVDRREGLLLLALQAGYLAFLLRTG